MFRIGEFSKLMQVSVRMLRYYDEVGLLNPAQSDPWTGYRMYSVEQIPVLNRILYLRDCGFTVAEMEGLVLGNDERMMEALKNKEKEIALAIKAEEQKLHRIDHAKQDLLQGTAELHFNVTIKSIPSCFVVSIRELIPDYYAEEMLWEKLSDFARQHRVDCSPTTFSIYHDEDYREANVDVELCLPVKKAIRDCDGFQCREVEEEPLTASLMVYGDFSNISAAYQSFAKWLETNRQYEMKGANRQMIHRGPWNEKDAGSYLTELQIPLRMLNKY